VSAETAAIRLRHVGLVIGDLGGRIHQLHELWDTVSRDDEARDATRDVIQAMLTDIYLARDMIAEYERWATAALKRLQPLPTPFYEE
jgi:hypothetical protein